MYTSMVDISNISPSAILKLLNAGDSYQVEFVAFMVPAPIDGALSCSRRQQAEGGAGGLSAISRCPHMQAAIRTLI